jgi:phage tail P2-like protein
MSSLLPPNSTELERALAESMSLAALDPDAIRALWNPATCPETHLPWLAWALSVDIWDDAWPVERKRATIAGSIAWHRKKGTPWAVEQALAAAGYSDSLLVEHRELHEAWLAAGGGLLDGLDALDGDGDLAAPGGEFRFTTRSWAEYAVRLNIGDVEWSRTRQREAVAICNAYAPARSQLVALIIAALLKFDSHITLASARIRARVRLAECRRFTVPGFDTLDGCDLIGGENLPEPLDGLGTLDGASPLNGYRPTGEPLDGGQLAIRLCGTVALGPFGFGGDTAEPAETLDDSRALDGRYTIAGETLDGYGSLAQGALDYPSLTSPDDTLDATSNLGYRLGLACIHHGGIVRIRRGSTVIQEPLQ